MKKIIYYELNDLAGVAVAKTIKELISIAFIVLSRMPQPVCWIAGPITSGKRKQEKNRERLRDTICLLKMEGATVFNYLPLQQRAMKILRKEFGDRQPTDAEEYGLQERLRDELYAPIFRSGMIHMLLLMPQSETSLNVHWMRGFAHAVGIPVKCIPEKIVPK